MSGKIKGRMVCEVYQDFSNDDLSTAGGLSLKSESSVFFKYNWFFWFNRERNAMGVKKK